MELKKCPQCGNEFEADQPWKRVCLDCWISNKNRKEQHQAERLQAEAERLRDENERYRRRHDELVYRISSLELALSAEQSRTPRPQHNGHNIPPDMLKRLIQLAHPDRHGGSPAANTATQWLLAQREHSNR